MSSIVVRAAGPAFGSGRLGRQSVEDQLVQRVLANADQLNRGDLPLGQSAIPKTPDLLGEKVVSSVRRCRPFRNEVVTWLRGAAVVSKPATSSRRWIPATTLRARRRYLSRRNAGEVRSVTSWRRSSTVPR